MVYRTFLLHGLVEFYHWPVQYEAVLCSSRWGRPLRDKAQKSLKPFICVTKTTFFSAISRRDVFRLLFE